MKLTSKQLIRIIKETVKESLRDEDPFVGSRPAYGFTDELEAKISKLGGSKVNFEDIAASFLEQIPGVCKKLLVNAEAEYQKVRRKRAPWHVRGPIFGRVQSLEGPANGHLTNGVLSMEVNGEHRYFLRKLLEKVFAEVGAGDVEGFIKNWHSFPATQHTLAYPTKLTPKLLNSICQEAAIFALCDSDPVETKRVLQAPPEESL